MDRPPATARILAFAQLAGAVVVAVIGIVGGVLMQVELSAPGPKWSADFYSRMLTFHGLMPLAIGAAPFAGGLGYLAIAKLVGAKRIPLPAIAWVAFGIWVIGIACSIAAVWVVSNDTGWTFYTPEAVLDHGKPALLYAGPLAIGAAAALYAVHLAIVVIAHRAQRLEVAIAVVLVVALGGAGLAQVLHTFDAISSLPLNTFMLVIGLGFATVAVGGDTKTSRVLTVCGLAVAVVWAIHPHVVSSLALAGIWITLAIMGGFARPAVAFIVFGCSPAITLYGLASVFTTASDVHLHDTHFIVGTFHLLMAVIGFAALAGVHTWFERKPNPIVAWIGGVVCCAGLFLQVYASLGAGLAGMPRRYWDYEPTFTGIHNVAIWGTSVVLVGAVMIAVAWFTGRSKDSR